MDHIERILIVVTRMHCVTGSRLDEFVRLWRQHPEKEQVMARQDRRSLVVIHGHQALYDLVTPETAVCTFQEKLKHVWKTLRLPPRGLQLGVLFHPLITDIPFIRCFKQSIQKWQKENLRWVGTYSSEDKAFTTLEQLARSFAALKTNAHFQISDSSEDFPRAFDAVWAAYIAGDEAFEQQLQEKHQALAEGNASEVITAALQQESMCIVWNENAYSEILRKHLGKERVLTSREEAEKHLKQIKYLLILAELDWEQRPLSHFYGYELARELIEKGYTMNIGFASFLTHSELRWKHSSAAALSNCFPHLHLQIEPEGFLDFRIPDFNPVDWVIIRHCYLSRMGICDRLLHDLQKLIEHPSRAAAEQFLNAIHIHEEMFSREIVSAARSLLNDPGKMAPPLLPQALKKFREQLESFIRQLQAPEESPPPFSNYQIMLVEDHPDTLAALQEGFGAYFKVQGFTDGAAALAELKRRRNEYAALLVDLELLTLEGSWQPLQGHHLIQAAQNIPHLVVYMLTAHSKRFVSVVQQALQSTAVVSFSPGYLPKHPRLGLRPDYSYGEVARALIREIEQKTCRQKGPQLGIWGKGLLQAYYRVRASEAGEQLWSEVITAVEQCIAAGSTADGSIPATLFSRKNRHFSEEKIRTVLKHRLICLYFQYEEGKIEFEKGLKHFLRLNQTDPYTYFTALLGFSIRCEKKMSCEALQHTCYLQKRHLFEEEINWLKRMFPENLTLSYPGLIEVLSDALSNPVLAPLGIGDDLKSIDSLLDGELFLKRVRRFPKFREELAIDLQWYQHYFVYEFKQLQEDPTARKLLEYIREVSNTSETPANI